MKVKYEVAMIEGEIEIPDGRLEGLDSEAVHDLIYDQILGEVLDTAGCNITWWLA